MFLENKSETLCKTIQLYEMVLVRHGVMVVGQTCSGKTATIHSLAKAMTKANTEGCRELAKVQIITINPKAVTSGQLYGLFDENTHEFVEGILAVTFRRCSKDTSPDRKWMTFDGPVDAVWIEVNGVKRKLQYSYLQAFRIFYRIFFCMFYRLSLCIVLTLSLLTAPCNSPFTLFQSFTLFQTMSFFTAL